MRNRSVEHQGGVPSVKSGDEPIIDFARMPVGEDHGAVAERCRPNKLDPLTMERVSKLRHRIVLPHESGETALGWATVLTPER